MSSSTMIPQEFKKYFWDVSFDELSMEKYPVFIAERILNYGDLNSLKWLLSIIDLKFIEKLTEKSRNLNVKTRNYWKLMLKEFQKNE